MQIKINIDAQHLTLSSNKIVSGTTNFVECSFTFSADWGELEKWALFKREKNTYEMYIEDNKCVIPSQCISEQGEIIMSVVGRSDGKNITATAEDKLLVIAGRAFDGVDEKRLTTTYLEETLGIIQSIRGHVIDSSEKSEYVAKKTTESAAMAQTAQENAQVAQKAAAAASEAAIAAQKAAEAALAQVIGGTPDGWAEVIAAVELFKSMGLYVDEEGCICQK